MDQGCVECSPTSRTWRTLRGRFHSLWPGKLRTPFVGVDSRPHREIYGRRTSWRNDRKHRRRSQDQRQDVSDATALLFVSRAPQTCFWRLFENLKKLRLFVLCSALRRSMLTNEGAGWVREEIRTSVKLFLNVRLNMHSTQIQHSQNAGFHLSVVRRK